MGKGKKKQQKCPEDNQSQESTSLHSMQSLASQLPQSTEVVQQQQPSGPPGQPQQQPQGPGGQQQQQPQGPQGQQQQQPHGQQQQQKQPWAPRGQQQQQQPQGQQQQQQPQGPQGQQQQQPQGPRGQQQQQPQGPRGQQQQQPQEPRGQQQQQPQGPRGQQQQQPQGQQQQQKQPWGPRGQQQQQQPQGRQQQQQKQQWGPRGQQQQQQPQGRQQQQQKQQWGPRGQQQQQQPQGRQQQQQPQGPPGQLQQQPQGPRGQQQQQPQGLQGQQQQQPHEQQQQQQAHGQQQQQKQPWGPRGQQQQQQPQGRQQQQQPQGPPGQLQQQPQGPRGQLQQQPQGPQGQQQQQPHGQQQQQKQPWAPRGQQQQQQPQGQQQQQQPQGPPGQLQQQPQGPRGQLQQQPQGPQGQQQQQPHGQQQQQKQPWAPRGQQQQQQPQGRQQQQQPQGPPGQLQQQPQGPRGQLQQQPQGPQGQQQQQPHGQQQQQKQPWAPRGQQQQQQPQGQQQQQQPQGPQGQQQQQQPQGQQQQQQHPQGPGKQQPQQQRPQSAKGRHLSPSSESLSLLPVGVERTKVSMPSALMESYLAQIPKRSNLAVCGKAGIPIEVETNMFKIVFGSKFQTNAIHYDVAIDPDKPKQLMRPIFEQFRRKHFPKRYPAYDGRKNAYSANDLPFGDMMEDSIEIFDNERQQQRTYNVKLTKVAVIDLSWLKSVKPGTPIFQTGVQALDVILRHSPASSMITVGRSLFQQPTGRVVTLSSGLDLWFGVFQSAVIGWKPYLNIDVAHKGFPSPRNVIDLMKELCQNPKYNDNREVGAGDVRRNETKITKFLKGLKVQYEIPGQSKRTQRVNGLAECPEHNKFTLSNGKVCTVQQYFAQEKRYKIRFPDFPCLWIGSREKKIYVPAELCTVVAGQVIQKKLDEVQTSKMVREAATSTDIRKQKILNGFASLRLNESPVMANEFQLSVQGQFEKVPARVLSPPVLQYQGREVRVSKGVWHAGHFYAPKDLEDRTWTILNLNERHTRDQDMYILQDRLKEAGYSVNIRIGSAQTPFTTLSSYGPKYVQNIQSYFQTKKDEGLKLVVVIIPDNVDAYSKVKQITELRVGVLTQCIRAQTLRKLSDATVKNILLKINSKLNGINHIFGRQSRPNCLQSPCMLVGADVTHPSPDATDVPSIAAVAASHDPNGTQYNIEIRLQPPREENILDLEEIMRAQLIYFYKKTSHKPNKIIFYRDGVGEGHLPAVMHFELQAIKKACRNLQADYNPPVTFLVVQKRHHIRLFPTDRKYSDDRNFNVQAGTIVDTEITHPSHIDFYLVSHASIQGTARPTKYKCICNENNLSEDEIEQLTYYLCHIFARCTRSVSYPAPTYYAHLAAFRARALTHEVHLQLDNLKEEQRTKMNLQIHKTTPMFFV